MTARWSVRALQESLGRAHDGLTTLGFHLSQVCLAVIVCSFSSEVLSRYFLNSPIWWANEVVSYALCIGAFLALPEVTRRRGHVAVTVIPEALPPAARRRVYAVVQIVGCLACAAVGWICLIQNISQYVRGVEIIRAVQPIPQVYVSVWITYGFLSSAIHFLRGLEWRAPVPEDAAPGIRI
jgi:TRAP-type C4-dicarboxylate transport system permease small subunit